MPNKNRAGPGQHQFQIFRGLSRQVIRRHQRPVWIKPPEEVHSISLIMDQQSTAMDLSQDYGC
jgi:hypothetical protein